MFRSARKSSGCERFLMPRRYTSRFRAHSRLFLLRCGRWCFARKKVCTKIKSVHLTFIGLDVLGDCPFLLLIHSHQQLRRGGLGGARAWWFPISLWPWAFLLGSIFPVLCHFGIRSDTAVGLSLSGIYMANILGSTAGPLITGLY